jgi:hypothetical protein
MKAEGDEYKRGSSLAFWMFYYMYFHIWDLNAIYERRAVGQLLDVEGFLSFLKHLGIVS